MRKIILASVGVLFYLNALAQEVNIVPYPVEVQQKEGTFQFTSETRFCFDTSDSDLAEVMELSRELMKGVLGFEPKFSDEKEVEPAGNLMVSLNSPVDPDIKTEGYKLHVKNDRIFLNANTPSGIFYGFQTLWQLLTAEEGNTIPAAEIIDYPRFAWRGLHLDVSRHFMPVEFIYKYIDYIAMHKMNVFHWHLVDDQGWRIEIKQYPKLTEVGAWRVDREHLHWDSRELQKKGEKATYGGFYTQKQVKDIVAYARQRNVTIVPEIEMPAHVMSALAAYPEYSCTGENLGVAPGGVWPITQIYCAGNDSTFIFLENILTEVMELFPSTFIHVGGDEADKTEWEKCPKCQRRIEEEGLADEHELQSYFISRIERFLNNHGRRLIGWDEILEGGLAPEATVMSWRGEAGGIEAAKMGHNVVMSPGSHCYFDHYQGDPSLEPLAFGGHTTLKKVYHYEPVPEELNEKEAKYVLGAQANVWTEFMPDGNHVEYMIFPRLSALSEVVWSPRKNRDWADFSKRMETQYQRYERIGANYATSAYQVTSSAVLDKENRTLKVKLGTEAWNPEVRYTLDGSNPATSSKLYTEPFEIEKTTTVKAAVLEDGKMMSKPLTRKFYIHKVLACPLIMKYANSKHYDASGDLALVDGIKGSVNHADGNWKGYNGNDMVATIDLGAKKDITSVEVGFLQNVGAWIFYPTELIVETSFDGKQFKKLGRTKNNISTQEAGRNIQTLKVDKSTEALYLRVTAKNLGMCPKGHPGEGQPAWLFVDEIIVE
jgi:hexosaminidase